MINPTSTGTQTKTPGVFVEIHLPNNTNHLKPRGSEDFKLALHLQFDANRHVNKDPRGFC